VSLASRRVRVALALLALSVTSLGSAAPALAAAGCPKTSELAMESKIMCQVCGVPLALANSLEADRERVLITKFVNRCESVPQIEATVVAQYGPSILASPGRHGFAITAWLVPVVALLAAVSLIVSVILLGRRRRQAGDTGASMRPASASEDAALDAALTAFDARR
jgi:cytochrome c-type biogenesis protein CcmH/NrfF